VTIKHFFSETAEAGDVAEQLVKEVFAAEQPGERLVRVKLVADELERFVVAVLHGSIANPAYRFYAVSKARREVSIVDDDTAYRPRR
jgi:hypothetical protein